MGASFGPGNCVPRRLAATASPSGGCPLQLERHDISLGISLDVRLGLRPTTAILALVQLAVAIAWPERVRAQEPESVRLSGYVRSAANEEVLRSARLEIVEREFSIATNRFGYYSIELVPGRYSIRVSTLGYETAIGPER